MLDLCRRQRLRPILGRAALLFLVAFAAGSWAVWGAGTSDDLVEIDISEQHFAIPSNYIASLAHDTHGSVKLVRLTVFWPTMEPLANRAPQELELPGPQGINVLLRKRPRDGYKMLQSMIKRGWLDENYEAGAFGLRAYVKDHERRRRATRRYVSAHTDVRAPSGDPIVFDCDDHFSWDVQESMDIEPTCDVHYAIAPGVGLTYWFYRKNLQSWREIDTAIRDLVHSFGRSQENRAMSPDPDWP